MPRLRYEISFGIKGDPISLPPCPALTQRVPSKSWQQAHVKGVAGLRVIDVSAMPRIVSANLNAPVQMMAARAADFILGRNQLTPLDLQYTR
ncbi:MAG: hypothetical protein EBT93_08710 [Alphaproteobacteria bacterium]|nr:hypothetical protein [Alphaproteobacteria bacterium]